MLAGHLLVVFTKLHVLLCRHVVKVGLGTV